LTVARGAVVIIIATAAVLAEGGAFGAGWLRRGIAATLVAGGFASGIKFFDIAFVVFVLVVVVIFQAGGRSIGGAGAGGRGDELGFAREKFAGGELDLAGGEADELGGAGEAGRLGVGGGADDEGGDDVARAQAEELLDGIGNDFGIYSGLRVEGEGGIGGGGRIRAGVHGGGADAVVAELIEELGGEVVEAAFDGGGDGAGGGRAIAIPAEDEEVALFLAEPREGGAGEDDGREETDVEALGERVDGGIEEGRGAAAGRVNDEADVPFLSQDFLDGLSEGGGIGEVYSEGDEVVVREGIAGELGGESVNPAAHTDEAPGNSEARAGVGAGN
jgi:hypothetical protein